MKNTLHDDSQVDDTGRTAATDRQTEACTIDRRSFLKLAGFTVAAVTAAGCERPPDSRVVPHVALDHESTPGTAMWYASTCAACPAGCGVLVRSRDNRPVKIEGNPDHPVGGGGLCAAGQAAVLGVYDAQRLLVPKVDGKPAGWDVLDGAVTAALRRAREDGGRLRVLSGTISSPTLRRELDALLATVPDARLVEYDAVSVSALLDAHEEAFGRRVLPRIHFDRARAIVSFDADFLGTWISPVEHSAAWARGRDAEAHVGDFSWHCQIEARMSLTGSKADERIVLSTNQRSALLGHLAGRIAGLAGREADPPPTACPVDTAVLDRLVARLWRHRGASLLVCGDNDLGTQRIVLAVNVMLGNYGATLDMRAASRQRTGNDRALTELVDELREGTVDVLVVLGANPVYDLPDAVDFGVLMGRAGTCVVFAIRENESTAAARCVVPLPHALEDWRDAEPVDGLYCLTQPTIPPRRDLRSAVTTFAAWRGDSVDVLDAIRTHWRETVYPRSGEAEFEQSWHDALRRGFIQLPAAAGYLLPDQLPVPLPNLSPRELRLDAAHSAGATPAGNLELILHPHVALPDDGHAGNGWLLELPDPITKLCWDNVASLAPATAGKLGVGNGDLVLLRASDDGGAAKAIELPVFIQEGQAEDCVAVALGFGGTCTARFAHAGPRWLFEQASVNAQGRVGARVSGLLRLSDGRLRRDGITVSLLPAGRRIDLALAQDYQYLRQPEGGVDGKGAKRPCLQERSLATLIHERSHGGHAGMHGAQGQHGAHGAHGAHGSGHGTNVSMWPEYEYNGHHWGMTIDLAACTGCSACVIGCQVENNIPVVGKDEVRRNRDLHWLRIDRYYFDGDDGALRVGHQPMLCHHCDNAPCETVCPVLATVHSEEGLNQQVYNRCVGTRYCANNCPYKVRRFNWFDYPQDDGETLVLNPDVTVRSRGIMEKCSFCVQRIQDAKIRTKVDGRPLGDGDVLPACMQSCPTRAIRFGDMNDGGSALAAAIEGPRHYRVLDELGIKPSVGYLMQVRNTGDHDMEEHDG